jgi:uncharacterized protein with NAD-binding domain and iron-sulfur cluster
MSTRVAILGGGVAGLSAAHELLEPRYEVTLYEKRDIFGGKARSLSVPTPQPEAAKIFRSTMGFGSSRASLPKD